MSYRLRYMLKNYLLASLFACLDKYFVKEDNKNMIFKDFLEERMFLNDLANQALSLAHDYAAIQNKLKFDTANECLN